MSSRLISIIRKEFIQILRDPRTLVIILLIPIVQLFLLGYAATTDVKNVPLAVWDQSHSPASRKLIDAFREANYFATAYSASSQDEIQTLIETGKITAALVIPPGYAASQKDGSAQALMILDGSDPTSGATALSMARLIGQAYATRILSEQTARSGKAISTAPPVEIRTQVWYNPDLISAHFMIPGVIGMILFAITSILTASAVVRERERGTIEQLIVTPIRPWELVVGKLLPYVILAFMDTFEVLIIGHWWFGVPIRGSLSLVVGVSGLLLLSSLGIGLFISTIANTQQEAFLTVFSLLLPSIFLAGFFFPIQAMPIVLQWISYIVPLRYFLVAIRALLLKGVGFAAIQNEIIALSIFGIVIMTAAALRFRKRLD
jgi:ABC-2 type transport system permease protein